MSKKRPQSIRDLCCRIAALKREIECIPLPRTIEAEKGPAGQHIGKLSAQADSLAREVLKRRAETFEDVCLQLHILEDWIEAPHDFIEATLKGIRTNLERLCDRMSRRVWSLRKDVQAL